MVKTVLLIAGIFFLLAFAKSSIWNTKIICERSRKSIQCPTGRVIKMQDGFYGRHNRKTCGGHTVRTTSCTARRSLSIIRATCDGRKSCSIQASNSVFGDPCRGTYKYVEVHFTCQVPYNGIRATICERSRRTVACPPGQAIKVKEALYGRKESSTCPSKHIKTTNCVAIKSSALIRSNCDDQNSCSIYASNSVFGDPCKGTYKYAELRYNCYVPYNGIKVVICENNKKTVTCPAGQAIKVKTAFYGREDSSTCPSKNILTTNCIADNSLEIIRSDCDDQNSCSIYASNSVFGDPCKGTYKYVEMMYSCYVPYYGIKKVICERNTGTITCPGGEAIDVNTAFYGRLDSTTCPGTIKTTHCVAAKSSTIIKEKCDGRNSCSVDASNSVFGDPCKGTYKYVEILYTCKRPRR